MSPVRVLLDTDIGTNVDDALALWYLVHEPACELLGVTTVTGRPGMRAALARAICADAGRGEIPVVAGAADPLEGAQRQLDVPLADDAALAAFRGDEDAAPMVDAHPTAGRHVDASPGTAPTAATELMAGTIARYPGGVVLVAIGPLTNVARLFRAHPDAAKNLRAVVAMIGRFDDRPSPRDTNLELDPLAAEVVLESAGVSVDLVGLDVTSSCRFSEAELAMVLGDVARTAIGACVQRWFRDRPEAVLHDPVTACAAVCRDALAWTPGRTRVARDASGRSRLIFTEGRVGARRILRAGELARIAPRLAAVFRGARR